MILKGNERGNGAELAHHLMNARDNEHVTVHTLDGFVADDLFGAFAETEAISQATQCRKYLFSLSLNPPPNAKVPVEAFEAAIAAVEQKLGLAGQPRAVVFREKNGRRHAHCIWSRIDTRAMKAINLPHFKRRLMDIAKELFITHSWDMPDGFSDAESRDPLNFDHVEAGQAKRAKRDPQKLKALFKKCWEGSDSRAAFAAVLWSEGYVLARGDRRGFVAVDAAGKVYSLSRWCGVRSKDLRKRLGDPAILPSSDDAAQLFSGTTARDDAATARQDGELEARIDALVDQQRSEREALLAAQERRRVAENIQRQDRLPHGIRLIWARLNGSHERIVKELSAETTECDNRDQHERQMLIERHLRARQKLSKQAQHFDLASRLEKEFSAALRPDPHQPLILPKENYRFSCRQLHDNPTLILDHISHKKARFERTDVLRELAVFYDDPLDLQVACNRAMASSELVQIDANGKTFTTRVYQAAQRSLEKAIKAMSGIGNFNVAPKHIERAIADENRKLRQNFDTT